MIIYITNKAKEFCSPEILLDPKVQFVSHRIVQIEQEKGALICTPTEWQDTFKDTCYGLLIVFVSKECPSCQRLSQMLIFDWRKAPLQKEELEFSIQNLLNQENRLKGNNPIDKSKRKQLLERDAYKDQENLINIGRAFSVEKDTDKLLRSILYQSKKITGADAGSMFLVEGDYLRFKYSHTFSQETDLEEFLLPIDSSSIAGHTALTGSPLNIPDVYSLPADIPFGFNPLYDKNSDYRTKSMLVVPMISPQNKVLGVIQLINSKEVLNSIYSGKEAFTVVLRDKEDFENKVVPFAERYSLLMEAVAGQAAIALENNVMVQTLESQFREFVNASIRAIENRDPSTSGHSFRVSSMAKKLALAVNETTEGVLADYYWNEKQIDELYLAGLLHDFGKVYVDSRVLAKAKKLYPEELVNLKLRFHLFEKNVDSFSVPENDRNQIKGKIKDCLESIERLNEPAAFKEDLKPELNKIKTLQRQFSEFAQEDGFSLLQEDIVDKLSIHKGSLNTEERKLIRSHVEHTYNFVKNIPWPEGYRSIPELTFKHHEMLDGSGYPMGLGEEEIPMRARILTIVDIYDALTSSDRVYKKALTVSEALSYLREEAAEKRLDAPLVELFCDKQIFSG